MMLRKGYHVRDMEAIFGPSKYTFACDVGLTTILAQTLPCLNEVIFCTCGRASGRFSAWAGNQLSPDILKVEREVEPASPLGTATSPRVGLGGWRDKGRRSLRSGARLRLCSSLLEAARGGNCISKSQYLSPSLSPPHGEAEGHIFKSRSRTIYHGSK